MIVAGFGFRRSATQESLLSALRLAMNDATPSAFAAPWDKAETRLFQAFAETQALPVIGVSDYDLAKAETRTHSARVLAERNTGSVAEAAAMAAAGPGAKLISPRVESADRLATCALAERDIT